jgi:hypothetical protein
VRAAAALLLALSLGSIASGQAPEALQITGSVIAASNGEALARVRVDGPGDDRAYPDVLTDDRGRFTLRVPRGEAIRLRLSKAGFATVARTLPPRGAAGPIRLEMDRGAAISGRIAATVGTPVRARVYVHSEVPGAAEPVSILTDDRGEFRAGGLPPGRYIVTATDGTTWTSRVMPDGDQLWVPYNPPSRTFMPPALPPKGIQKTVVARAGEDTRGTDFLFDIAPPQFGGASLKVALHDQALPPGSLSGTVVDEHSEPMQGVVVQAQHLRTVNGRTVALTATEPVETDDRGQFRLFPLRPGEYVVTATVTARLGGEREYPVTYAGGSFELESAARWFVGESEVSGVGVTLAPYELFTAAGTVLSATGAPGSGSVRLMMSHRSGRPIPEPRNGRLAADGSFSFSELPAGDYVVHASTGGTLGTPAEFGVAFATVGDGPRVPLVVRTAPLSTLSGRIIVDGPADQAPPAGVTLRVVPADPDRSSASRVGTASLATRSDGTFYITGLAGRNRVVLVNAPDGWFMKELLVGAADAAAEPFDFGDGGRSFDDGVLVVSPLGAVLTGRAEPERDGPIGQYWVVVFPADERHRISRSQFIKYTRASEDGTFRIGSLPPGAYYVAAVRALTPPAPVDEWQPAELDRLAVLATRVTIAEGETRSVRPRLAAR